jgi:hypothetical protein
MADMTDSSGTGPLPSGRGPEPEFQNVVVQLTGAERSIAIGALIIVVLNLLIGDLILGDYHLSNSTWLISVAALGAMYFFYAGERTAWHTFYPWMVEMGAWALAAIGGADLIRSLFDGIPSSGATLAFQIILWIAAGFAGVGAFQLRTQG